MRFVAELKKFQTTLKATTQALIEKFFTTAKRGATIGARVGNTTASE